MDRVRAAAESAADHFTGDNKLAGFTSLLSFGDQALKTSQANVFRNLLFGGRQAQMSWEWLKGRKTSVDDAQTMGTQKSLTDVQDFVFCLLNIGQLFKAGTKKRIVFLIDEAEAFRSVTSPDSQTEIQHALRLLLENSNTYIGLILAIQVEAGQEGIGVFFEADDIKRRVDYEQGYIDLTGMVSQQLDAKAFIEAMLDYLIDQEKAAAAIKAEGLDTTPQQFPFTAEAIEGLCSQLAANPERALPASIISIMSSAAIKAWRGRDKSATRCLVDSDIIETIIYPEG